MIASLPLSRLFAKLCTENIIILSILFNVTISPIFIFIDDFVDGLFRVIDQGQHLNVYHIGTSNEIPLSELAEKIASIFDTQINLIPGDLAQGGTLRRCPDISKLRELGFDPRITLEEGLRISKKWYVENKDLKPSAAH